MRWRTLSDRDLGSGLEQRASVGVGWRLRDLTGGAEFNDLAAIHDGDACGEIADHWHGMRDEEIGEAEFAL